MGGRGVGDAVQSVTDAGSAAVTALDSATLPAAAAWRAQARLDARAWHERHSGAHYPLDELSDREAIALVKAGRLDDASPALDRTITYWRGEPGSDLAAQPPEAPPRCSSARAAQAGAVTPRARALLPIGPEQARA